MIKSQSDTYDEEKDYDYEVTIATARRYVWTIVIFHIIALVAAIVVLIQVGDADQKLLLAIPIALDVVAFGVDLWELNCYHFFRLSIFRCLIFVTFLLSITLVTIHSLSYVYVRYEIHQDKTVLQTIALFVGAGAALIALLVSLVKNLYVKRKMVKDKQEFNKIKNSLISQEHFNYALKKSLSPHSYD